MEAARLIRAVSQETAKRRSEEEEEEEEGGGDTTCPLRPIKRRHAGVTGGCQEAAKQLVGRCNSEIIRYTAAAAAALRGETRSLALSNPLL